MPDIEIGIENNKDTTITNIDEDFIIEIENNDSTIYINEDNSNDTSLDIDLSDEYNTNINIAEQEIVIEIEGLKSFGRFIDATDTPSYYTDGKFLKSTSSGIVYDDVEWKDITGDLSEQPELKKLIEESIEEVSQEVIDESIEKHNTSEEAHEYIQNKITDLQSVVDNNYSTLNKKINTTNTTLEKDVSSLNTSINNKYNTLDNKIDDINSELSLNISNLSTDTYNKFNTVNNRISNVNSTLSNIIDSNYNTLDTKIESYKNETEQNFVDIEDEISDKYRELKDKSTNIDSKIVDVKTELQNEINITNSTVTSNYNILDSKIDSSVSNLDTKITNVSTDLNSKYNEVNTKITNVNTDLTNVITSNYNTLDTKINDTENKLSSDINSLDTKIDNKTSELDTKITNTSKDLTSHIENKNNPHNITKEQLQLENVDNTSDLNKPISTATQNALSLKANSNDVYTKSEVDAKVSSVYRVKGSVNTYSDLPTDATIGDVYNVLDTGSNYVWTGTEWDKLSETVDLTPYLTKESAQNTYETISNVNTIKQNLENTKQDKLSSGSNIKTINGNSLLGSGDIEIKFSEVEIDDTTASTTTVYSSSKTEDLLSNKADVSTIPTKTSDLTNDSGFINSVKKADVEMALGYIPYDASNPNGYTSNIGTVTSVNNVEPIDGKVEIEIPEVHDGILTITRNGVQVDTFSANQSSDKSINISVPTDNVQLKNGAGYITGIGSSDVIKALGYTPYDASNPDNFGKITEIKMNGESKGSVGTVDLGTVITDVSEKQDILYQEYNTASSNTIVLNKLINIYFINIASSTSIYFNTSNIDLSKVITFELRIKMTTVSTITFPSSVHWLNDEAPDMDETGVYYFVFRLSDSGTYWIASLQGRWSY